MQAVECEICCGLRLITGTDALGATDAYSKKEAKELNTLRIQDASLFEGDMATAGLLVISDQDKANFKRAKVTLKKMGWKFLGKFPGAHQDTDGEYSLYLYGSREFKLR